MATPELLTGRCRVGKNEVVKYDLYYVRTADELPHLIEWARTQTSIGLDIETDGMSPDGLKHLSNKIATVQIGNPKGDNPRAYVICMRGVGAIVPVPNTTQWTGNAAPLQELLTILEDKKVYKLGQNIRFEQTWLMHVFGTWIENMMCCQIAELDTRAGLFPTTKIAASDAGEPNRKAYGDTSMAALSRRYLKIAIEKGEVRRLFWVTPPGQLKLLQLEYAAGDVIFPYYILREQLKEIKLRGLKDIIDIDMEMIPILVDSQLFGMWLDQDEWKVLWQEAVVQMEESRQDLDNLFREQSQQLDMLSTKTAPARPTQGAKDINYDSPPQVRKAFVAYCKSLDWPYELVVSKSRLLALQKQYGQAWLDKRPDKLVSQVPWWLIPEEKYCLLLSLEAPDLKVYRIKKMLPKQLINPYLRYKEAAKRVGTYGVNFLDKNLRQDTQCIHTYFHLSLTSTGRLSSEPNLQNIPRDPRYRACFKPRTGYKYIICDYSQIEPRLTAEASKEEVYRQTFLDGADIYCRIGEAMSGSPIDKKKDPVRRQMYKTISLALAYNMGPGKLHNSLILDLEKFIESGEMQMPSFFDARELHKGFQETHQGLRAYQLACIGQADPVNPTRPKIWDTYVNHPVTWVTGLCGRKRFFPEDSNSTYTEAPNAPIQGTSATITKLAAIWVMREARQRGLECHIVNLVHDELIVETPIDDAEELRDIVKEQMEAAGRRYIKSVPVIADFPETSDNGICTYWIKE